MAFLFGKYGIYSFTFINYYRPSVLLKEVINRLIRDVNEFETFKDFLRRDVLLSFNIISNPIVNTHS